MPFRFVTIPKGTAPFVREAWVWYEAQCFWQCDPALDPDITYEIVRILDAYKEEMVQYDALAGAWNTEWFADMLVEEQHVHPGALRYYDEVGLEVTYKEPPHLASS